MASWRLKVFCTLWWMLIGVFIIQSWMSFLVCSFLSLIPSSFRHHHVSLKSENIPFWSFSKRSQMLHSTHEGPLTQTWRPARKRMNDRKKKKRERHTLGTMPIHSTQQYWGWLGEGCFGIFFFFFAATIILNKCHHILPAQGNIGSTEKKKLKKLIVIRLTIWPWKALPCGTKLPWALGPLW